VLIFVDEPCVIDGNLVSGRTYRDSGRFIGPWISLLDQPPGSASWISLLDQPPGGGGRSRDRAADFLTPPTVAS
jgi:hypothetical protein